MSQEVLEGQRWLNATYGGREGYRHVKETGLPGTAMSEALVSALQIELDIGTVTGVFGEQTSAACDREGLDLGAKGNRVRIIQYGLYSKGYNPGSASGTLDSQTLLAVAKIIADAGVTIGASDAIRGMQAGAILGVDEYKLVAGGDSTIRTLQQDLNRRFRAYSGLCACDGHYSRSTNRALIYAIQATEGMPVSMATGYFGPSTKAYLPDLWQPGQYGMNGPYTAAEIAVFTQLAKYTLYCFGRSPYKTWTADGSDYDPGAMDGSQSSKMLSALHRFQKDVALPGRDLIGLNEWMGMLVSTGNPMRDTVACDCATQLLTPAHVKSLRSEDYTIVGRYLTGGVGSGSSKRPKNLTAGEIQTIFAGGMRIFAIYEDNAAWLKTHDNISGYFTHGNGVADAARAIEAAKRLGLSSGEIIYFAVDYDFMAGEVATKVIPYFKGVDELFSAQGSIYRVGVYSARNTCAAISNKGLAQSSFVADMSTGYSGNLGYPLPSNWAFDQIMEYTNASGFAVDKCASSGRYNGFASVMTPSWAFSTDILFHSGLGNRDATMEDVPWDDSWFDRPSSGENKPLAVAACALSALAYSGSSMVKAGFLNLQFPYDGIKIGEKESGAGPIGYAFATKLLGSSGARLVVVDVRGTANKAEWESNMDVSAGASSTVYHHGFKAARDNVRSALDSWAGDLGIDLAASKILVTGHSRGAAVANLLAYDLLARCPTDNVFGYTFATPNVATTAGFQGRIRNFVNPEDFVPQAPLVKWEFGKYGPVTETPSLSNTSAAEYKRLHDAMQATFRKMVGRDQLAFESPKETDDFVGGVGFLAPNLDLFYNLKFGNDDIGKYTVHEYFMLMADAASGDGIAAGALAAASICFPTLGAYLIINKLLNSKIGDSHGPETYLSWLRAMFGV